MTTKFEALVDALRNLSDFVLLPGQAHDMKGVEPLIKGVLFDALLVDKAFNTDWLLTKIDARGAGAVIPPKASRKIKRDYNKHTNKWRHLIERFFANENKFRAIATRYEKMACRYAANWHLAAAVIGSR